MRPTQPRPPVLLIGMHRSGTSLLSRMLDDLGMFMGWRLAPNHGARFFNTLNAWLLGSAGGRWDTPKASEYLRTDPEGRRLAVEYLRDRLAAPPAVEFLGPARYLRHRSLFGLREPWGFKFAQDENISHLGIMAHVSDWYRDPDLIERMKKLKKDGFFDGYDRVIFGGVSMGRCLREPDIHE